VKADNPSTALAVTVIDELVRRGVTDLVLCPGSRNAPLAFAALDADRDGGLRMHTRIDERTAGFLALGLAKSSRRPVAVVTTSGTAVANLFPAVLEASHAGVPLLVLTADRPAVMRGTGANQTPDHAVSYGKAVRAHVDLTPAVAGDEKEQAVAWRWTVADLLATATARPGPVHLNLQFGEPLVPGEGGPVVVPRAVEPVETSAAREPAETPAPRKVEPVEARSPWPRTVVVAGDDAGPPARVLAERAHWPLFAEPSSGSRTGPNAIRSYRLLLDDPGLANRIERVVVCGHPTLSRPVTRLLASTDVEIIRGVDEGPTGAADRSWLDEWLARDAEVSARLDALLDDAAELLPHHVAREVARALPRHGLLFVGASNPIRDLDLVVPRYEVGGHRLVLANRGLSGIDGTLSSAIGAALGRPTTTRAFALVGDVTFLHDSNALVIGPGEPRPDLTIVVVNDNGGSIFASLEQGAPEYAAAYERLFGTPHGVDLAALCAATHTPHRRVCTLAELPDALATPADGIEVIEAVVRRDNRRELDARIRALV
jgi:2-succinyl-5-enolpyruvyl-6-hydroxy-3-cyclohexene-1-carboxylate synthase